MLRNEEVTIFGDGETSRDFCFVANAVQANIRAAFAGEDARGEVYNVAVGAQTSLSVVFALIRDGLRNHNVQYNRDPHFTDFRQGDVRHSLADIGKARRLIGYAPTHSIEQGIAEALPWYIERLG
jgi:UDP-N-acetylglucosamine 4-epimerase